MKKIISYALIAFFAFAMFSCGNEKKAEQKAAPDTVKAPAVHKAQPTGEMATVIDFYATWCGPCKAFAPTFEKMEKKYAGKINFKRVDVDQDPALANKYKIEGVPTIIILPAQGEVKKFVGLMQEGEFEAELTKLLPAQTK